MSTALTLRQQEILNFIIEYTEETGFPPSIREIGKNFGYKSLRGVTIHLDALQAKNVIERDNRPRSIRIKAPIVAHANTVKMTPVLGTIAAGQPVLAQESIEQMIPVPAQMVKNIKDAFLLRVKGDSMNGEGILPRDLVLIKPQKVANQGDLVAALVEDEATVKRIYFDKPNVKLVASNPSYDPIIVHGRDVTVIGKVIGLMRDYENMAF